MVFKIGTKPGTTFWLNAEPCGLICGCMTWFLLFFGMFATSTGVIIPWLGFSMHGMVHLVLFNTMSLVALYSHIKVMTTDPGAVPPKAKPLLDDDQENEYIVNRERSPDPSIPFKKYCRRCKAYKPQRAHHCSICGRCIVKMDHHCPWVNNCVGVGNHKLFLLFVFWVFVTCMYSMLLVLAKYIICIGGGHKCHSTPRNHFLVIFLVVESILFGLFTLCMLGDQLSAIGSNQTQIDRLKGTKHNYQMEVNEVCGSARGVKCHHTWFIPTAVKFAEGVIRDKVLGYRLLHSSGGSASGAAEGSDEEEFSPLMELAMGSGGTGGENDGDVEMGNMTSSHPLTGGSAANGNGNANGGSAGITSSPGGGFALRKKLGGRGSSQDDQDSLNTSNDSNYGNEESITEWFDDHHSSGNNGNGSGNGHANGSNGNVAGVAHSAAPSSNGNSGDKLLTPSGAADALTTSNTSAGVGLNHIDAVRNIDASLSDVDLDGAAGGGVSLKSVSSGSPGSPHVVLKAGAVNNNQNHNTTRRKRSGFAWA